MAPISPCQSGRRVITDDRTVRLSSMLSCVYVCVYAFFVCVLYPVRMSGHCGRCGYSSISTISLRSIASLPLLSPHHSVTPPPPPAFHLGVQRVMMSALSQGCLRGSRDTVTVSRNPSRLLGESSH